MNTWSLLILPPLAIWFLQQTEKMYLVKRSACGQGVVLLLVVLSFGWFCHRTDTFCRGLAPSIGLLGLNTTPRADTALWLSSLAVTPGRFRILIACKSPCSHLAQGTSNLWWVLYQQQVWAESGLWSTHKIRCVFPYGGRLINPKLGHHRHMPAWVAFPHCTQ